MAKTYEEAEEYLNSKELCCDCFIGKTMVKHNDFSVFIFSCSIIEDDDDFLYLWSEHNGYHVWDKDDLDEYDWEAYEKDERNELWRVVDDFIYDQEIRTEKDIKKKKYTSRIYAFIKELCEVAGYHEDVPEP